MQQVCVKLSVTVKRLIM